MTDRSSSGTLEMTTSRQDFKLPLEIQVGKGTCWCSPAVSSAVGTLLLSRYMYIVAQLVHSTTLLLSSSNKLHQWEATRCASRSYILPIETGSSYCRDLEGAPVVDRICTDLCSEDGRSIQL